jgi:hypothetical protein
MSDDPNNSTPDNTQAALAPQPGNGTPSITPDVQALIEQARAEAAKQATDAAWKQARLKYEKPASGGGQQPQTKPSDTHAPQPQTVDVRAEINRIRSFERAAGQYGLNGDALAVLEDDFNTANPSDPAEWVHRRAKAFGFKAGGGASNPATPGTAETPAPTKITPQNPPVTGSGSPANPTTQLTSDTPILRMSDADRIAYARRDPAGYVKRMREEFKTTRVRFR